jgi:hypothetical protein
MGPQARGRLSLHRLEEEPPRRPPGSAPNRRPAQSATRLLVTRHSRRRKRPLAKQEKASRRPLQGQRCVRLTGQSTRDAWFHPQDTTEGKGKGHTCARSTQWVHRVGQTFTQQTLCMPGLSVPPADASRWSRAGGQGQLHGLVSHTEASETSQGQRAESDGPGGAVCTEAGCQGAGVLGRRGDSGQRGQGWPKGASQHALRPPGWDR